MRPGHTTVKRLTDWVEGHGHKLFYTHTCAHARTKFFIWLISSDKKRKPGQGMPQDLLLSDTHNWKMFGLGQRMTWLWRPGGTNGNCYNEHGRDTKPTGTGIHHYPELYFPRFHCNMKIKTDKNRMNLNGLLPCILPIQLRHFHHLVAVCSCEMSVSPL